MDISLLADTVTNLPSIQPRAHSSFQVCAAICPPPVKSSGSLKTLPRIKRRTRRRSLTGVGGSDEVEGGGDFHGYGGDCGGGSVGWGGGGAGGGRWNFDGLGWSEDEESEDFSIDRALYVVYKVVSWITLSNCLQFAADKMLSKCEQC